MPTSASLRRGDIVSEIIIDAVTGVGNIQKQRDVMIEKVVDGYVQYLGDYVPVIYVYGIDLDTRKKVGYTRTLRYRWESVVRAGSIGVATPTA